MNYFDNEGVRITNIEEVNGEIILTVFLSVRFYDYVINTNNDSVIRGNKDFKILNNYIMTFIMSSNPEETELTKCPNCGASIEHITSGECEYCYSTIVKKPSKFVLSKKTNVNK